MDKNTLKCCFIICGTFFATVVVAIILLNYQTAVKILTSGEFLGNVAFIAMVGLGGLCYKRKND